jgi:hypothetical protein
VRVPQEMLGERLIAVVPMVGAGRTEADPIRPKHTPVPLTAQQIRDARNAVRPSEAELELERKRRIVAFTYVLSDDGKSAIVEFVANDRAAFSSILEDREVRVFEKRELVRNAASVDAAKTELQRVKRDFDFSQLRVAGN